MTHGGEGSTSDGAAGGGQPGPPAGQRPAPWTVTPSAPPQATGSGTPPAPPPAATAQVPAAPTGPPSAGRGGRRVLVGLVALALVAASAGVTWFLMRESAAEPAAATAPVYGAPLSSSPSAGEEEDGEAARASTSLAPPPSASAAPSTSTRPADPAALPESQALAELEALRARSLPRLVLDGRWVAQVASKAVGITDPLQWAANGTHTFYARDILIESRTATAAVADPSSVLVLTSTDFGKRSYWTDGQPFWTTVVDGGFSSAEEVDLWCARTFATLTPEQLANACAPRTLAPPHD